MEVLLTDLANKPHVNNPWQTSHKCRMTPLQCAAPRTATTAPFSGASRQAARMERARMRSRSRKRTPGRWNVGFCWERSKGGKTWRGARTNHYDRVICIDVGCQVVKLFFRICCSPFLSPIRIAMLNILALSITNSSIWAKAQSITLSKTDSWVLIKAEFWTPQSPNEDYPSPSLQIPKPQCRMPLKPPLRLTMVTDWMLKITKEPLPETGGPQENPGCWPGQWILRTTDTCRAQLNHKAANASD